VRAARALKHLHDILTLAQTRAKASTSQASLELS